MHNSGEFRRENALAYLETVVPGRLHGPRKARPGRHRPGMMRIEAKSCAMRVVALLQEKVKLFASSC